MRIVEDDGSIDDDFPALDRNRKIEKFAFDAFAISLIHPENMLSNARSSLSGVIRSDATSRQSMAFDANQVQSTTVFLKVHLYSTIEVKQTTIIQMPSTLLLSAVFKKICEKRKYNESDYVMKMADNITDAPIDKTLMELGVSEFCVVKRYRGGAGDIFLTPKEKEATDDDLTYLGIDDYKNMFKVSSFF